MTREAYPRREFRKFSETGTGVCRKCAAVYKDKRWILDESLYRRFAARKDVDRLLCPACRALEQGIISGVVTMRGSVLYAKEKEIMSLLRHEETRARRRNPLARFADIALKADTLVIHTTTTHLAEKVGHAISRAYKGRLEIKPSPREEFVRVNWVEE